jgi:hypothetical protein
MDGGLAQESQTQSYISLSTCWKVDCNEFPKLSRQFSLVTVSEELMGYLDGELETDDVQLGSLAA